MIKLSTPVTPTKLPFQISLEDKIVVLGSCFADSVGEKMKAAGFNVLVNPFGTLYNPASVYSAISRMSSGNPYEKKDCVQMGAGAGKICSFEHHTSFARANEEDFLDNANKALAAAHSFWKESTFVIITLGTSWIWEPSDESSRARLTGGAVSNCLKLPAAYFNRRMLSPGETCDILQKIQTSFPDKKFIFTVSPIRHLSDGAHNNTLSKAALQLGIDSALKNWQSACYFPSYEILLDELRDYRFYAEDLVHPSKTAVDLIWQRFREAATRAEEQGRIDANEKETRSRLHRTLLSN